MFPSTGDAVVPAADCSRVEYSAHPKTEMTLREYVKYWGSKVTGGEEYSWFEVSQGLALY